MSLKITGRLGLTYWVGPLELACLEIILID